MSDTPSSSPSLEQSATERAEVLRRALVTAHELADLLGLTTRTITELAARNIVVRVGPGRYVMRDSIQGYIAYLRNQANADGSLAQRRAEESAQRAKLLRLKVAEAEGALVPSSEVEAEWTGILRGVRARMLAVPSRFASMTPGMTAADVAALEAEVRLALVEAGQGGE